MTIDTSGNIHSETTGQFTGHTHAETSATILEPATHPMATLTVDDFADDDAWDFARETMPDATDAELEELVAQRAQIAYDEYLRELDTRYPDGHEETVPDYQPRYSDSHAIQPGDRIRSRQEYDAEWRHGTAQPLPPHMQATTAEAPDQLFLHTDDNRWYHLTNHVVEPEPDTDQKAADPEPAASEMPKKPPARDLLAALRDSLIAAKEARIARDSNQTTEQSLADPVPDPYLARHPELTCPNCGGGLEHCPSCSATFRVYEMDGRICPECGTPIEYCSACGSSVD